jgi:hypothetical protein
MPGPTDLELRTMRRDELDLVVDWAAGEGWNPGLGDAHCFYAVPAAFCSAFCEENLSAAFRWFATATISGFSGSISSSLACEGAATGCGFGKRE